MTGWMYYKVYRYIAFFSSPSSNPAPRLANQYLEKILLEICQSSTIIYAFNVIYVIYVFRVV